MYILINNIVDTDFMSKSDKQWYFRINGDIHTLDFEFSVYTNTSITVFDVNDSQLANILISIYEYFLKESAFKVTTSLAIFLGRLTIMLHSTQNLGSHKAYLY